MNETLHTIRARRSTRNFDSRPIGDGDLDLILEAGRFAPSGMNRQPWHFSALRRSSVLAAVDGACREALLASGIPSLMERAGNPDFSALYQAPLLIIVSGDGETPTASFDCSLALGTMFLAAESLGIGTCWIHAVRSILATRGGARLRSELQIPEGYGIEAAGVFGYRGGPGPSDPAPRREGVISRID